MLWHVWHGEEFVDRPTGPDLLDTLTLSVVVMLAAIEWDSIHIHVAVGLAALGLLGTIALAKCVAYEQAF